MPSTLLKFLWFFVKKQKVTFSLALFTALVWAVNEACFPFFIKKIINGVAEFKGDRADIYQVLMPTLTLLFGLWILMELCQRVQGTVLIYFFPRFRANIRGEVLEYVKKHSYNYFSNHYAGGVAKRLTELPNSCQNVLEIFVFNFISIIVAFAVSLYLMWEAKPLFAHILLAWFVVHVGLSLAFLRAGEAKWHIHSESVTALSGQIVDSITNIASVKLFARRRFEKERLWSYQRDEMRKSQQANWMIEIMRALQGVGSLALIVAMVATLLHGWQAGWVTVGDISLVMMSSFSMMGLIWYLSFQINLFTRERGTINEALQLVARSHEVVDVAQAPRLQIKQGSIVFERVSFGYKPDHMLFDNLSVEIKPGEKVGLVGFSGSGKSTFVNLILRFFDIQQGQILIDGQNIAKVKQDSLREQIALIPQDPSLFHRNLIENIRYGRIDATDEEVFNAAKRAHCNEFISELDEGYQTLVGERGVKLSGGQRQRISIARALLKNAPILILDEATSALDSVTEKVIQASLQESMKDRTTLVIAHRLSTLGNMDRILVFEKGKIIEDGSKEALLAAGGHFAKLWSMQHDGFFPQHESAKEVVQKYEAKDADTQIDDY